VNKPLPTVKSRPQAPRTEPPGIGFRVALGLWAWIALGGVWLFGVIERLPAPYVWVCVASVVVLNLAFVVLKAPAAGNVLLAVLVAGLATLASDGLLRWMQPKLIYFRAHETLVEQWPPLPQLIRYKPDASYAGRVYGDLAAYAGNPSLRQYRHVVFQTDHRGFRNSSDAMRQPLNVLILGDSFGVGNGTTQEATWSSRLAAAYGLSVYNLSMPGNPRRLLINCLIEKDRLSFHPDAAVLLALFAGNDLDEVQGGGTDLAHLSVSGRVDAYRTALRNFQRRSAVGILLKRLIPDATAIRAKRQVVVGSLGNGQSMAFYAPYVQTTGRSVAQVRAHPNFEALKGLIVDLKTVCDRMGVHLKVTTVPAKCEIYDWVVDQTAPWSLPSAASGFSVAVARICSDFHIPFYDMKADFKRRCKQLFRDSGAIAWYCDDTHFNPAGHRIAADLIYRNLLAAPRVIPPL
jgi:hypothetical protein